MAATPTSLSTPSLAPLIEQLGTTIADLKALRTQLQAHLASPSDAPRAPAASTPASASLSEQLGATTASLRALGTQSWTHLPSSLALPSVLPSSLPSPSLPSLALPSPSLPSLALPSIVPSSLPSAADRVQQFKVVMVGEGGVGKTTWMKRLRTGEFDPKYIATLGVEVHSLGFPTPKGGIVLEVWDTAGQDKLAGLRDGYYLGANAGMVVYDSTYPSSYRHCLSSIRELKRVCGEIPIILVGTKIELDGEIDEEDREDVPELEDYRNFYISTKVEMGLREPLDHLVEILVPSQ